MKQGLYSFQKRRADDKAGLRRKVLYMYKFYEGNAHGVEYEARTIGFRDWLDELDLPKFLQIPYRIEDVVKFKVYLKRLPSRILPWTHVALIAIPDIIEEDLATNLKTPTRYLSEAIPIEQFEKSGYEIRLLLTETKHEIRIQFRRKSADSIEWERVSDEVPIAHFNGLEQKQSAKQRNFAIFNAVLAIIASVVTSLILQRFFLK